MKKVLAVFLIAFISAAGPAFAQKVDLTEFPAFVRVGFDTSFLKRKDSFMLFIPEQQEINWRLSIDSSNIQQVSGAETRVWLRLPARRGNRPIIIRDLALPGMPEKNLFPVLKGKKEQFCILIPFTVPPELFKSRTGIALFLPAIGQNWQVYLNGILIKNEVAYDFLDLPRNAERALHGAVINVNPRILNPEGQNIFAFMVEGDPLDARLGLSAKASYLLDTYETLFPLHIQYVSLAFIGVYLFFAAYHFVLFLLRPKNKSYLMFSIGSALLALHLFCKTYLAYDIIQDTKIIRGFELATMIAIVPAFLAFFDTAVHGRASIFTKVFSIVSLVPLILQFFFWREAFQLIWTLIAFIPALFVLFKDVAVPFRGAWRHYRRLMKEKGQVFKTVRKSLSRLEPSRILLGLVVVGATVSLNILNLLAGTGESVLQYGFMLLVFGTATVLAGQFARVYTDIETVHEVLEKKVTKRTEDLESSLKDQESLNARLSETASRYQAVSETATIDMQVAVQVQQGFFPKLSPKTEQWEAAFVLLPASGISGDFFDFYLSDDGKKMNGLVVGDVSGHGIASGLVTVLARSIFYRNFHEHKKSNLGNVMEAINTELIKELASVDNYLTAALLRLDDDGRVEYTSAAHTEICYKGADKPRAVELKPRGVDHYKGLPMGRAAFESPYKSIRFKLNRGDFVLIYTDGMSEGRNVDHEEFGLRGVLDAMSTAPTEDVRGALNFIMQEWRFHTSGTRMTDDVTAVLLRRR